MLMCRSALFDAYYTRHDMTILRSVVLIAAFMAGAFSEPTLIRLASGFEHVSQARRQPKFVPYLPVTSPSGGSGGDQGGDNGQRAAAAGARAQRALTRPAVKPKHL